MALWNSIPYAPWKCGSCWQSRLWVWPTVWGSCEMHTLLHSGGATFIAVTEGRTWSPSFSSIPPGQYASEQRPRWGQEPLLRRPTSALPGAVLLRDLVCPAREPGMLRDMLMTLLVLILRVLQTSLPISRLRNVSWGKKNPTPLHTYQIPV